MRTSFYDIECEHGDCSQQSIEVNYVLRNIFSLIWTTERLSFTNETICHYEITFLSSFRNSLVEELLYQHFRLTLKWQVVSEGFEILLTLSAPQDVGYWTSSKKGQG